MPLEVTKANDLSPNAGSLTIVAGPPGMGKSTLAGTVAEYLSPEEVLVLATLPREVNSMMYQHHNLDTIIITDKDWDPQNKKLEATGYGQFQSIIRDLRADTKYGAIILDNGTELAELAWHASMAPLGVGDPNDLGRGGNRFAPYTTLREKMEQAIRSLSLLTGKTFGVVARPKLIIIPWHVQPPREGDDDESADERGKGSEYEGSFLPMVRGAFRRRLMGLVDGFIYADLQRIPKKAGSMELENRFCLQVVSDNEKHCKLFGVTPDSSALIKGKFLDVHNRDDAWRHLMNLIHTSKKDS